MKKYIRTFSKRELASAVFTALVFLSFTIILSFFIESAEYSVFLVLVTMCVFLILTHHFYLIEHKRRNRFLGRIIHDILIITILSLLTTILLILSGTFYLIGSFSNTIFFSSMLVLSAEIILSILNRIFILFKLRVW